MSGIRKLALFSFLFLLVPGLVRAENYPWQQANLYIFFFVLIALLFVLGYWKENVWFLSIAGLIMAAIGVYTYLNGAGFSLTWLSAGYSYAWVFYCSIIFTGIGIYYAIVPPYMEVSNA